MLIVLMYHRVTHLNFPTDENAFYEHLRYLVETFPIVTPGDPLSKNSISVCLTFDDAYFDFYHIVFPLLRAYHIKAVLAVPVKFICDDTQVDARTRLSVPYHQTMENSIYSTHAPFCTWKEIKEMSDSGHVEIASHSFNHVNLLEPSVNFQKEITESKKIIEEKIGKKITTFVYPFGKMSRELNKRVLQDYTYPMRIGFSINLNWHNLNQVIYRIDAEHFWPTNHPWSKKDSFKYFLKFLSNSIRLR